MVYNKEEDVEEIIKTLSKGKNFLLVTVYDIEAMLNTMRSLLQYLTKGRYRCIIDYVYKKAVSIVEQNRLDIALKIKHNSK